MGKGANVNLTDNNGDTPLLYVRILLRGGASTVNKACAIIQLLVNAGANINAMNNDNRTLLTYSVSYLDQCVLVTRALLNSGCSVWYKEHPQSMTRTLHLLHTSSRE